MYKDTRRFKIGEVLLMENVGKYSDSKIASKSFKPLNFKMMNSHSNWYYTIITLEH